MTRDEILAVYHAGPEAVIALVEHLLALIAQQQHTIDRLDARVRELETRLGQNSRNSSKPPSSDGLGKKTKNRRPKSDNKPGAQPGHPGHTLSLVDDPHETIPHAPSCCEACGCDLSGVAATRTQERRQVFELPPIALRVTEHRVEEKVCPHCACVTRGRFPEHVTQPTQYGDRLSGLLVYLTVFQMLPNERLTELMNDLLGTSPAEGTIHHALERCFAGLAEIEAQIRAGIREAPVAGFDETGVRIGGKLHWLHTASTRLLTLLGWHPKRGREGMDAQGILPGFGGRAVHDGGSSYWGYGCEHALCNAHHLRELTAVAEQAGQEWAAEMIDLLVLTYRQVEQAREAGQGELDAVTLAAAEAEYARIVAAGRQANPRKAAPAKERDAPQAQGRRRQSKAQNLLDRLARYEPEVLAFMRDFRVPFDNNQAERDLRMMKVQQKISGGFRSEAGASRFCRIRSYVTTMRKQGQPILAVIESVLRGHPIAPQLSA
jgi:transposase